MSRRPGFTPGPRSAGGSGGPFRGPRPGSPADRQCGVVREQFHHVPVFPAELAWLPEQDRQRADAAAARDQGHAGIGVDARLDGELSVEPAVVALDVGQELGRARREHLAHDPLAVRDRQELHAELLQRAIDAEAAPDAQDAGAGIVHPHVGDLRAEDGGGEPGDGVEDLDRIAHTRQLTRVFPEELESLRLLVRAGGESRVRDGQRRLGRDGRGPGDLLRAPRLRLAARVEHQEAAGLRRLDERDGEHRTRAEDLGPPRR